MGWPFSLFFPLLWDHSVQGRGFSIHLEAWHMPSESTGWMYSVSKKETRAAVGP